MSQKHVQWLREELPALVSQGVLTAETAEHVQHYYSGREGDARGRNRAVVLFSVLGAALVGSGIILLLAHNWDEFSRVVRTVLSFAPLIIAQPIAGWVLWTRRDSIAWREGAGIALTLAIGTSISLIAQTYNISGDFGRFMLTWTLLALPVVYLLDATAAATLYMIGVTVWSGDARFTDGHPLWFWVLLGLVLPHLGVWRRTPRTRPREHLAYWTLALCLGFGTGFTATDALANWWILAYAGLLPAIYLIGERWFGERAGWWQRPFQTIGSLGGFGLALLLTFKWPWHEAIMRTIANSKGNELGMGLIIASAWPMIALLLWITSLVKRRGEIPIFGALPVVAALGYAAAWNESGEWIATILFDIFLFVWGVGTLWRGLREDRLGVVNAGMLMLSALIITRFFDSDLGFVVRGLAFIGVGIGFFATNLVLIRRKGAVA